MAWTYDPVAEPGQRWRLDVRRDGHVVGRIVQSRNGLFQFFPFSDPLDGPPLVEEVSLAALQRWLERNA
jgi:hypothetical protein